MINNFLDINKMSDEDDDTKRFKGSNILFHEFYDETDGRTHVVGEPYETEAELAWLKKKCEKKNENYISMSLDYYKANRDVINAWKIPKKDAEDIEIDPDWLEEVIEKQLEKENKTEKRKAMEEYNQARIENDFIKEESAKQRYRSIVDKEKAIKVASTKEEKLQRFRNRKKEKILNN